ncbi:Nif3-like dinuclear metal center hexameric protein [Lactococcus piscium]|uniref:GTP cyclohydrolase 1 type 2 homolog n=1 Tax=Pseudolactococcus piscium MKFS47 TaxID=297352 RepID=A0A0D6DWL8_9LACT|nr:Nif3-like dinuclear metal center hexameric protein [Lactococcus piscium]CEN27895.1 NGG1-interacting factor-like protein [Lactococcus piscium MKFS47]
MKIQEVIDRLMAYHPDLGDAETCDGIKFGDAQVACTGIVSALVPTVEVIKQAISLGANLLIVHEPTSYLTPDWSTWRADFDCQVYDEKIALIQAHQLLIFRDHDHMHAHQPDQIFTGVLSYLGWLPYLTATQTVPFGFTIEFPESKTLQAINQELMTKIGMNGLRYIGNGQARIKKLAFVGHLFPDAFIPQQEKEDGTWTDYATEVIKSMVQDGIECIIPGEVVEWTVLSYIRDANAQGKNLACINPGHFNWEELGAKYAAAWLKEITDAQVPVTYVATGDLWQYQIKQ